MPQHWQAAGKENAAGQEQASRKTGANTQRADQHPAQHRWENAPVGQVDQIGQRGSCQCGKDHGQELSGQAAAEVLHRIRSPFFSELVLGLSWSTLILQHDLAPWFFTEALIEADLLPQSDPIPDAPPGGLGKSLRNR